MKVAKFGGSSLSCEEQFKKVKQIVKSDPTRQIIVVSALGKRRAQDDKITDLLYILAAHLRHRVSGKRLWEQITQRFWQVKQELGLQLPLDRYLTEIEEHMQQGTTPEYLVSRGEFLTALLVSNYLGYQFVDAKELLAFHYDGKLDQLKTEQQVQRVLVKNKKIVVPGFYGAYPNGEIHLMSRGGSDVTGAILASVVEATLYENWTDVAGILLADPQLVADPVAVSQVTYQELQELSFMGANVLHEEAISPVEVKNIPIQIKNTNQPQLAGTTISETSSDHRLITGITGKKGYLSLLMSKRKIMPEVGFLNKMMNIFHHYQISIEYILSGYDNVRVIFSQETTPLNTYQVMEELETELALDEITLDRDLSLIAVVGRASKQTVGLSGKVFTILGQHAINVSLISQSNYDLNVVIGVRDADYQQTIKVLYEGLVQQVFA